jgi:hypothetical protein
MPKRERELARDPLWAQAVDQLHESQGLKAAWVSDYDCFHSSLLQHLA